MTAWNELPHVDMANFPDLERHRDDVRRLVERAGTPLFLCDRDNLADRYHALDHALQTHWGRHLVAYSFKTNYLVAKSRVLQDLGAWAEVVSWREYELARELDYAGDQIIFNGPLKPDAALRTAIADGALINVNDHDELDRLLAIVSERTTPLQIGIRVSSTLPRLGHSRFGFSLENDEAASAASKIYHSKTLELAAVHTHLYGDTDDSDIYGVAAERLGEFVVQCVPEYQRTVKVIDMGGGYPAHTPKPKSRTEWSPQPIEVYIQRIATALRKYFPDRDLAPTLVVEPGRYLTGDGVMLVTRVVHAKNRGDVRHVNCDGSISMVPLTHYCPQVIRAYTSEFLPRDAQVVQTMIHGSTCRENDLLYDGPFPTVYPGDYLVHYAAGAYNSSLSPDFIFASPGMEVF